MAVRERKAYIDFLKVIGLSGIILAHVDSPDVIMMARSFDVPFMVFLSAILAADGLPPSKLTLRDSCKYILKRVKRLVIPTWIFLTFFFLVKAICGEVNKLSYYIYSFLLTRYGIGYVWIVLIYVYCALLTPAIHHLGHGKKVWIGIACVYFFYELCYARSWGCYNKFIMSTFYYLVPYGIITAIGFHYQKMSKAVKLLLCILSDLIFALLGYYYYRQAGSFQLVHIAKYPPRLYYLSYALFASVGLLLMCEKRKVSFFFSPLILFFSKHSFWVYLWHIFYLWIFDTILSSISWWLSFLIVVLFSGMTVYLQQKILDGIEQKFHKKIPKYLRG